MLLFIVCLWRRFKVGPFSGFPLWSAPQKAHYLQTIELTFFTLLKLKFSLGINFPNKSEKMFDQIIFYSLKIRLFLLRKIFSNSSLTDKQNLLFFLGISLVGIYFETLQKFAWPLFHSKFGKEDVYLRFRAENFWVKPRFWQWLPAEHE